MFEISVYEHHRSVGGSDRCASRLVGMLIVIGSIGVRDRELGRLFGWIALSIEVCGEG